MLLAKRFLSSSARFTAKKTSPPDHFRSTVLLPTTPFPARLEGEARLRKDREVVASGEFESVYRRQQEDSGRKESFVLHDGPPYANGEVHLGHAVNKILKDVFNRWKLLQGCKVHYRPGWDCHGLPIELKVHQASEASKGKGPLKVRDLARKFALKTVAEQKEQFMSWGVMADWEEPYLTLQPEFVKRQLRLFGRMHEKKLVFRRYMPVYWSPSSRTALAESELEYKPDHVSRSAYIRFLLTDRSKEKLSHVASDTSKKVYLLIWTTTPWSLVANRAVCYNQNATYCLVEAGGDIYVVAKERLLRKETDLEEIFTASGILGEIQGSDLSGMEYEHPLSDLIGGEDKNGQACPTLPAGHVTLDVGTGLVYTAPAHGPEDYLIGLEAGLRLDCPVDEDGRFTHDAGEQLAGREALGEGSQRVLDFLRRGAHILKESDFEHSYPYDWRTKQPVILRASQQWFIDVRSLREAALEALRNVQIRPESARAGLIAVLDKRPYWCISRQRVWGVPIPAFYDVSSGLPVVTRALVERYCSFIDTGGTDFWWSMDKEGILRGTDIDPNSVEQGTDIMDVWFDSGISWSSLEPTSGGKKQADLYLEGLDQLSGWFYSSLLTSMALQGISPYKELFVHGFTMDDQGKKMSKSLGNVISPKAITQGELDTTTPNVPHPSGKRKKKNKQKAEAKRVVYGTDVLRLWVAAHASQTSAILAGDAIFAQTKKDLDRIRLIFRFILGNLATLNNVDELSEFPADITPLDRLALHRVATFATEVAAAFDSRQPNLVVLRTLNYLASDLSAGYFTIVKDRLYCEPESSWRRRSAVTTLYHILHTLKDSLAPICPVLAREVEEAHPLVRASFLEGRADRAFVFRDDGLACSLEPIQRLQKSVSKAAGEQGKNQGRCLLTLAGRTTVAQESLSIFEEDDKDLTELYQVSRVRVLPKRDFPAEGMLPSVDRNFSFSLEEDSGVHLCPRCRRLTSLQENSLCARCDAVVAKMGSTAVKTSSPLSGLNA